LRPIVGLSRRFSPTAAPAAIGGKTIADAVTRPHGTADRRTAGGRSAAARGPASVRPRRDCRGSLCHLVDPGHLDRLEDLLVGAITARWQSPGCRST